MSHLVLPSFLLAAFLAVLAVGLFVWHRSVWRQAHRQELDQRDLAFVDRQFRRRRRISVLLLALGAAIAGGEFVREPVANLLYWMGTLLVVMWIVALALLDLIASQQHFGSQRAQRDAEAALLLRQFKREFGHHTNGQAPGDEKRNEV